MTLREDIIKAIYDKKVIAIVRGVYGEECKNLLDALYRGGIRLVEFTFDQRSRELWESTLNNIQYVVSEYCERMYCGAGTVVNVEQVELAKASGASFIVSPNTRQAVIEKTLELGMVSLPGAMTPTEIEEAYAYGADFVKIFPASELGPGYIKSLKGPLGHIPMLAVGGVSYKNVSDYLKAGAVGFGIGGELVDQKLIEEGNFDRIEEVARMTIANFR